MQLVVTAGGAVQALVDQLLPYMAITAEGGEEYAALVSECLVDAAGGQPHGLGQFADRSRIIAALGKNPQRLVKRCVHIEFARAAAQLRRNFQ